MPSRNSSSSTNSGLVPLSINSQGSNYNPKYNPKCDPRYAEQKYSSSSSGSSRPASKSSSDKHGQSSLKQLSIHHKSDYKEKDRYTKTADTRYHKNSYVDAEPSRKPLSIDRDQRDPRYYHNSSY